jgi:hypothetical protein
LVAVMGAGVVAGPECDRAEQRVLRRARLHRGTSPIRNVNPPRTTIGP